VNKNEVTDTLIGEIEYKIKEFIDEDLCLLIIRHFNRENFPKEEQPIKYILLFFILILPHLSLDFNFRNQLTYWISYVSEKK